jgi:cyclopropane fatty-acyl-phospholipid synthase-like methyltransferase
MTDFGQIKNYAGYIKEDPFRRGLHFPAVEEALGDLNKRRILDVGCGDGLFPRLLAERGASVVGYDRAPEKIAEARGYEDARRLDVKFVVATPHTFSHDGMFDAATSVMVIQYAASLEEWRRFSAPHRDTLFPEEDSSLSSSILRSRLLKQTSSSAVSPSSTATNCGRSSWIGLPAVWR